ncbi:MAG: DUF2905 domain-containing protein [Oligoflexales bacterium]
MSRYLITFGLLLIVGGLAWPFLSKLGLFRLPGDLIIKKESFTIHFPIVTCILISIIFSVFFWIVRNLR